MERYSLIPKRIKQKGDPRTLAYYYPTSLNIVAYAKKMQEFSFYQALAVAEDMASKQGYILVPWSCMNWQRAKNYGSDRKVKIGRKSFFIMRENELTKSEQIKLQEYLRELE